MQESPAPTSPDRAAKLAAQLDAAIAEVGRAKPFAKSLYQGHVFDLTVRLLKEPGGAAAIHALAPRLDPAGVFHGGDWDAPERLQPGLAGASLRGAAYYVAIEALSELRMLAIAGGTAAHPAVTPEAARAFLEQVLALNIDLLFPSESEADRAEGPGLRRGVERLFAYIAECLGYDGILSSIVAEADRLLEQRPILVDRVTSMLERIARTGLAQGGTPAHERLKTLIAAFQAPTGRAREHPAPEAYAAALARLAPEDLAEEAQALGQSLRNTGLAAPHHAVFLRNAAENAPETLPGALGLDAVGRESLAAYTQLVRALIARAIHTETCQAAYGLACFLDRGILFFPPVGPGLWRHLELRICPAVAAVFEQTYGPKHAAETWLLAGILSVLGQPLGVGQGRNPTCQSARAISLWAQHDLAFLLELIAWASRDDEVDMHFEGQHIVSSHLTDGLAPELHAELDPVSLMLVPHLDRVYAEMGRRTAGRGEDGHKWINPEFHGWWVNRGFAIVINVHTGFVRDFESFLRIFYAAYHPYYNGNRPVIHPQPAGVAATNPHGAFVGWHAVSIQRVMLDPHNEMRVYFYNPNNDGGQDWGQGIRTATSGNGEYPGESSLPFAQFAARVYVFHFNWRELGDANAVPAEELAAVRERVREGWAARLPWDETPHDYLAEYAHVDVKG